MNKQAKLTMLATALMAILSSTAAMGQQLKDDIDWTKDFTSRITLNGYAQAGWSNINPTKPADKTNSYNLKRTLLWAKARITDRWSFLFMHDFSSVVQEFYTDYRISNDRSLNVRFGQFKHSYSMENPLSPTQLELIDVYSQPVLYLAGEGPDPLHGVNYGRDQGLMVFGDLFKDKVHYELALMSGQGINRADKNNQKDIIAKLEVKPIKELRLVVSGQKGKGHAVDSASWNTIRKDENYRRDRYSIGAELKLGSYAAGQYKEARPVSLRTEWLGGKDGDVSSQGGYATLCVPVTEGIDVIASGDYFDRNTSISGWKQVNATIGLQYWFYKKCRVQMQYTRCFCGEKIKENVSGDKNYNWLQAQVQVAF